MRGLPIVAPAHFLIPPAHAISGGISVSNFSVVRSVADSPDEGSLDGLSFVMRLLPVAMADGRVWFGGGTAPAYDSANINWMGKDKNLNGIRGQDAEGNWTETDFLANDSDVDGSVL